jgi:ABC-type nitrate/sulfonate/bicarbonate transport system substrate-binding protein
MIMKKTGVVRFWVVLAAVLMMTGSCSRNSNSSGAGNASAGQDSKPVTIRLGRVTAGPGSGPLDAAIKLGDFKAAGINLEVMDFSNGADGIAAMLGGSLDVFQGSYEHVLRQIENGLDVKAFALFNNRQSYKVLIRSNAPYTKLEDLKGKTLGVTKVGSLSDTTLRKILRDVGIDPERDVEIINTGNGATVVAALDSGNVAAAMVGDTAQLEETGRFKVMYDPDFETAGLVLLGSSKWAAANADALRRYLKIYQDQTKAMKASPEKYVAVFKDDFPNYSDSLLLATINEYLGRIPVDLVVTKPAADDVVETQLVQGTIKRAISLEEAVDSSYLP